MPELTAPALATLGIAAGALVLFLWSRLPVEVVGVLVMATLMVTGILDTKEAISGFSNEATITVALMLVLSIGLLRTGAVDMLGAWAGRMAGAGELRLLVVVLLLVVPVSAFLNNTAVVAIMIPVVIGLAQERGVSPSRVLMPLSFASQLGGTLTLIGTSANLVVAGLVLDLGLGRIRLFDITAPGLVLAAVGIGYLLTVGRWLMPERTQPESLRERYELHDYLTGLIIEPGSRLANRSLAELRFTDRHGLSVLAIERDGIRLPYVGGSTVLREGDLVLAEGKISRIAELQEAEGIRIAGSTPPLVAAREAQGEEGAADAPRLAELMVPARSRIVGRTLTELAFRTRYGVSAIALQRHNEPLHEQVNRVSLRAGDVLLVEGTSAALEQIHGSQDLMLLGPVDEPAKRTRKMPLASAIMALVVLLPALDVTTIVVSALLGALAMVITGCLTPEEAYSEVDWSVLVLLGSLLPLGLAMQQTGAAEWLGNRLLWITMPLGAYGLLAGVYLLTTTLTELVTNAAAAVILTPLAAAAASAQGLSPWPFVIAVMIAASNSFVTPVGYQTNLFVYTSGGYRFSDFARVGGPLALLLTAVATFVIPIFFPFHAR